MSMIERYRSWYEHERDCNQKMLAMIESVPDDRRNDPRFAHAVDLAGHLAACRENWLDRMTGEGGRQVNWWEEDVPLETLRTRFSRVESAWTDYLGSLTDEDLERNFEFPAGKTRYRWNVGGPKGRARWRTRA